MHNVLVCTIKVLCFEHLGLLTLQLIQTARLVPDEL
jgi:hypothetical protein